MKILYIDPFVHTAYSKKYSYYDNFFEELSKICDCYLYKNTNFDKIQIPLNQCLNNNFIPDIIFLGNGWFNLDNSHFSKDLGLSNIDIPKVGYLCKAQNYLKDKLDFIKRSGIDLMISGPPKCSEYKKITGVEFKLFPYGADANVFYDRKLKKKFDIGFSGALHDNSLYIDGSFKSFNIRRRAQNLLSQQKNISSFLCGSDNPSKRIGSYEKYAKRINQSKIWLATPGPQEEIIPRYFEIGMSSTLLFCSEIPKEYSHILKDMYNCVVFKNDLSDFLERFYFCLRNWNICEEIINNAYSQFHQKHTWISRAYAFKNELKNLVSI